MRLSEFQEQWRVIREELEESGFLGKRAERKEETEPKATKGGIPIGVIFSRGRQQEDKGE